MQSKQEQKSSKSNQNKQPPPQLQMKPQCKRMPLNKYPKQWKHDNEFD